MEITDYQKSGLIPLLLLLVLFPVWTLSPANLYTHITWHSSGFFSSGNWNLISSCTWNANVSKMASSSHLGVIARILAEVNFCESGLPGTLHCKLFCSLPQSSAFDQYWKVEASVLKTLVLLQMKLADMSDWCYSFQSLRSALWGESDALNFTTLPWLQPVNISPEAIVIWKY